MNSKTMKTLVLGAVGAYGFAALALLAFAKLGVLPVQADVAPSRLEATLLGSALRASVARHAPDGGNPLPASQNNLVAGARVYSQMCSRCHGVSAESDDTYGRSFYPPAPRLALEQPSYSDAEMFWIVKHGIRNTAMPAWGNLLSDEEIWQVVIVLRKFNSLPDSVTLELEGRHHS
jgi:mono/diheme cytochrome c family protein